MSPSGGTVAEHETGPETRFPCAGAARSFRRTGPAQSAKRGYRCTGAHGARTGRNSGHDGHMKILLVEDQALERERTERLLEDRGYVVDAAATADEALDFARVYDYAAAIVDLHLTSPPTHMEGLALIGQFRRLRRHHFPVLVMTLRNDVETEVQVFEAGGNEFVTKPYLPTILLIRLHAMIQAAQRRTQSLDGTVLRHGPIELDVIRAEVRVHGRKVDLPAMEFRLLKYLLMTGGTVSTNEIVAHVWPSTRSASANNVHNLVSKLRRLLDPDQTFSPIRHVPEIRGYCLNDLPGGTGPG